VVMAMYLNARHNQLLNLLVSGASTKDAAAQTRYSVYTVRRFKKDHWQEIRELQERSTATVLAQLEEMLPLATARLKEAVETSAGDLAQLGRTVRTIFQCYAVMKDRNIEDRLLAVERQHAELQRAAREQLQARRGKPPDGQAPPDPPIPCAG
jgi:hypothetical protein